MFKIVKQHILIESDAAKIVSITYCLIKFLYLFRFLLNSIYQEKVIIELKSVETLALVHHKQLLTYLKLTNLKLGILVNFNTSDITKSIIRKVNGL